MSHIKKRDENSSKRENGTLLSVCGSDKYRGAAILAAYGAMRTGVGLYCAASTERVLLPLNIRLPEALMLPMISSAGGMIDVSNTGEILLYSKKSCALLCGCGLGISYDTKMLLRNIIMKTQIPLILDADALNIVSEDTSILKQAAGRCIVTPHYGEMARLCSVQYGEIASDPLSFAEKFSEEFDCVTVLKGSNVYVSVPGEETSVYSHPNSGLAKGGSGDLLAGIIASLAAQGNSLDVAAKAGVYIHGEAACITAERLSAESMLASDIADDIYKVFRMNEV